MYFEQNNAIPLCERGSRASKVLDFGIGLIIILPHSEGTMRVLNQTLENMCKNEMLQSFLKITTGIESTQQDLPINI